MPHPSHSALFDHSNNIRWGVQIIKLLIMQFDHSPVNSSLLGPYILLNTLFSNTLSLCSSFNVSDQVLHPYKRGGGQYYCSGYLNLYVFGKQPGRRNILYRMRASIPRLPSAFNLFLNRILICYGCSQIYELLNPSKEILSVFML